MSKSDKKWINNIREELNNYSPPFEATDWVKLEKNLPQPKEWLNLNTRLIKGIKLIAISSIIGLAVYLFLDKNDETGIDKPNFKTATTDSIELIPNTNTFIEIESKKIETRQPKIKPNENITNLLIQSKERTRSQKQEETGSILANKRSTEKEEHIDSDMEKNRNDDNNTEKNKPFTDIHKTGQINNPDSSIYKHIDKKDHNDTIQHSDLKDTSIKHNPLVSKFKNDQKQKKPNSKNLQKNNSLKRKKKRVPNKTGNNNELFKFTYPAYIGGFISGNYNNRFKPYNPKLNVSGGLFFEKYISKKSSISVNPKISINKFKYNKKVTKQDTTEISTTVLVDSIPTIITSFEISTTDISQLHSLKLAYVDFPLIYNYYFSNNKNHKFGASVGFSNKYILSLKQTPENTVVLKNKFYFLQSGIVGLTYQKRLNRQLYFTVEPYWEFPINAISENRYKWNTFGVNLYLKINTIRDSKGY